MCRGWRGRRTAESEGGFGEGHRFAGGADRGGALDTAGGMACGVAGWTMTEMTVEGVGHGSG